MQQQQQQFMMNDQETIYEVNNLEAPPTHKFQMLDFLWHFAMFVLAIKLLMGAVRAEVKELCKHLLNKFFSRF